MNETLSIAFSIADYCFERTRTIGQMNLAISLVKALGLRPEIREFVVFKNSSIKLAGLNDKIKLIDIDYPIKSRFYRIFWDQIGIYLETKKHNVQWLFLPKGFSSFIRKPPVWLAAYIHDVVPEFYNRHYPKDYNKTERIYFLAALKSSLKNASIIFTNSDFVISEVDRLMAEWKIQNYIPKVSIGAGFEPSEKRDSARSNRIFVLVSPWRHKRSDLAIDYLTRWQKETDFVGGIDFVGNLPKNLCFPDFKNWRHYPRLPEDDYRKMFNSSAVVVYFSEYEGFGMPPVEAIINGIPAVYSKIPALTEVMDDTGFAFDNNSYEDFKIALNSALKTPEENISKWAKKLLSKHDLHRKAEKVARAILMRQSELIKTQGK
jgi:hypothetical protein